MYLDYFKFTEMPFGLTPNVGFFCELKGHQEALNVLLFSLRSGEGFIKIIGEVGSGKTLLCRKLLDSLGPDFVTAYIPNPDLNPIELRKALACELDIKVNELSCQHELFELINKKLLQLHAEGKSVVLLIDESQALPLESLEALRLLTNLETTKSKLLQVVLFGQPELDEHIKRPHLRQLEQRITFSYYLPLLSREDLDTYLFHRLAVAGLKSSNLFAKNTRDILYRASRGVPRIVNILCHKALLVAYGKGEGKISKKIMLSAIHDTEIISLHSLTRLIFIIGASLLMVLMLLYVYLIRIH